MAQPIKEHGSRAFALPGATPPIGFAIFFLMGASPKPPLENILGRAKRQSRNRTRVECFLAAQLLENIPHEEVFRGMQILWINIESRIAERNLRNEIRNAVWAKRVHWVIWRICVPASELRTFSRSFFCFGFLSGDRKKMKIRLCPAKNAKKYR